jgi:HPt (histidine-containing phosphotransfer) domain-containing protein
VERALQRWSGTSSDEKPVLQTTGIAEENKVFDRAKMLERVGGDEEICTDILKTFLDDIPARIGEMEDAYHHGDTGVLRRAAHTIKGAAGNVSATLLQNAAAQLEAAVIAGEQDSLPLKLDSVRAEFARVKEVMK